MKITFLLILLLFALNHASFSQDTTYFSNVTAVTLDKSKALYFTLDKLSDSCKITLFDIKTTNKYTTHGLKMKRSNDFDYYILDGETLIFHPNGVVKEKGIMKDNQLVGLWEYFYPTSKICQILKFGDAGIKDYSAKRPFNYKVIDYYNEDGKQLVTNGNGNYSVKDSLFAFGVAIKNGLLEGRLEGLINNRLFEEIYENGELLEGMMTNKEGEKVKYYALEVNPEFIGGLKAMYKFIGSNLKYPRDAQKKRKQGKVYVKFVVEKDAEIKIVEVLKGVYQSIDEEAVRVIKLMSYKFSPGSQRGIPVRVYYTMPISFMLD